MNNLQPRYQLTATLSAAASGSLVLLDAPTNSLTAVLLPVLQGNPGQNMTLSADPGNTASLGQDGGLYVAGLQLETAQW